MMNYYGLGIPLRALLMTLLFVSTNAAVVLFIRLVKRKQLLHAKVLLPVVMAVNTFFCVMFATEARATKFSRELPEIVKNVCEMPIIVCILLLLVSFGYLVLAYLSDFKFRKTNLSRASIKESLDKLPTGLCFYLENGKTVLVNNTMNNLCFKIVGRDLQNAKLFWEILTEGEVLPEIERISSGEHPSFRLTDGKVWTFSRAELEDVIQLVAADTTDLSDIFDTPAEIEDAEDAKAIIGGYIQTNMGNSQMSTVLTDIFAYGILGYMHNFDVVMDRIYALNPDADVVVIGIQNLLHGVVVEIDGNGFPLGDLYGNFVDMANYYASSCSPHNDDYLYVKAGTDEHVSVFLDQMRSYDDVEELNSNVIDCYNFYDDNLFIQMTLDKEFANFIDNDPMYSFIFGLMGVNSGEEFITNGKAEQLGNIQGLFDDLYWPALDAAYDTLSVVVKEVATMGPVKADLLLNGLDISAEEDQLKKAIVDEIMENVMSIVEGVIDSSVEDYVVDIDKVMPDDEARIVTAMYVRFFMGNSFFLHPDETGHSQIMTAVIGVIDAPNTEKAETLSNELKDSVEDIAQLIAV